MLVELTISDFLNKVAGSDPVPGGGSIAALHAATAAALTEMVANLTIGKKKYEEKEDLMKHLAEVAAQYRAACLLDVDRDSEAYNTVFAAFKLPKETEQEKAERSLAIQEATKLAANVPMEVARNAYQMMDIIADVAKMGNQNAVTDACVAMMTARAAVCGALMNVRINLTSIKDIAFATALETEADQMEALAYQKEKELLDAVKGELKL